MHLLPQRLYLHLVGLQVEAVLDSVGGERAELLVELVVRGLQTLDLLQVGRETIVQNLKLLFLIDNVGHGF